MQAVEKLVLTGFECDCPAAYRPAARQLRSGSFTSQIHPHPSVHLNPQRWLDAFEAAELAGGGSEGRLAAQALYVLEVTRLRPDWADWSVADNTFASPEVRT